MKGKFEALRSATKHCELIRFWRNDDPVCPHCEVSIHIAGNELWNLYEEGEHEIQCPQCEGDLTVSTNVRFSFSTDEQDMDDEEQTA